MPCYRIVDGSAVRPEIRAAAENAAAVACTQLRIAPVSLAWFKKGDGPESFEHRAQNALGFARKSRPDEIMLSIGLETCARAAVTAAHECWHHAEWRAGVEFEETDADAFGVKIARLCGYDVLSPEDEDCADALLAATKL